MEAHPSGQVHLEVAHILFIDTVGYSKLPTTDQRQAQKALNSAVRSSARFQAAEAAGSLIRLPTGDGMALVFTDHLESPIVCALEITHALREQSGVALRMGIHSGPVTRLTDVNDRSNVAGTAVNVAERIMACADANHILLSKRAADDLAEFERWRPHLHPLGECAAKHGLTLSVVNFFTDEVGNSVLPEKFKLRRSSPQRLIPLALALVLLAIAFVTFLFLNQRRRATPPENPAKTAPHVVSSKSIAVLPFANLSKEEGDVNFADAMQDEILTDLCKVSDLKVISRTSTMPFRAWKGSSLREIAEALGAAHVVEGTVQREGQRVRVNVQLIDARTDTHIWAEKYERDIANLLALESELSETIVSQLKAELLPAEKAAIEEQSTADPLAHELYLQADSLINAPLYNAKGRQNLLQAADLLQKAVARDPNYFRAYCKLALAHNQIYLNGPDHSPARLALAAAAIKEASRLRPDAGETHLAIADHRYCGYLDYEGAERELELAKRSLPNEPLVFQLSGFIARRQGRWEESTEQLLRALELDPRNTYTLQQVAGSYQMMRHFDDARAFIDRALAILPVDPSLRVTRAALDLHQNANPKPLSRVISDIIREDPDMAGGVADDWFFAAICDRDLATAGRAIASMSIEGFGNEGVPFPRPWCEALVERVKGDAVAERAAFTRARDRVQESFVGESDHPASFAVLGMIDAALGRKDDAIREARRAVELLPAEKDAINGALAIEYLAVTYAWTGEKDQALQTLKKAVALPGDVSYGQLRLHPFWDPLRRDPEFEKIVASLAPKNQTAGAR